MKRVSNQTIKMSALAILLIPLGILSLFLVGEVLSGDLSGLSHAIQMIPLLALTYLAWKKPFIGGLLLAGGGLVLTLFYLTAVHDSLITKLSVVGTLFVPAALAGALLMISEKQIAAGTGSDQNGK